MFQVRKIQRSLTLLVANAVLFVASATLQADNSKMLVGTWEAYKDDNRKEENIPKEVMSFWEDGKFQTLGTGNRPSVGSYQVDGDTLELTLKLGNQGFKINRDFEFSGQDLKFRNQYKGWVYYRRISNQPEGQ